MSFMWPAGHLNRDVQAGSTVMYPEKLEFLGPLMHLLPRVRTLHSFYEAPEIVAENHACFPHDFQTKHHGLFGKPTKFFLKGTITFLCAKSYEFRRNTTEASFTATPLRDKTGTAHTFMERVFRAAPRLMIHVLAREKTEQDVSRIPLSNHALNFKEYVWRATAKRKKHSNLKWLSLYC